MDRDNRLITRYNLLIATGLTPQVITETIYSLARQTQPWLPARVIVLTTSTGAAYVNALLSGKEGLFDGSGEVIGNAMDRWTPFCAEVLGGAEINLETQTPQRDQDIPIDDIQTEGDDRLFADRCYRLVDKLTQPGELPLIGSISGGRKTMSAHMMTAFSVFGRRQDRLVHVLVPGLSADNNEFFYTTSEMPYRIARVDIPFPKFNVLLEEDLLATLPHERRNLQAILEALVPFQATDKRPAELVVHLGGKKTAQLLFYDANQNLINDQCTLSLVPLASLLVFIEATRGAQEDVARAQLMTDDVHALRLYIARKFGRNVGTKNGDLAAWTDNDKLSDAVYVLNRAFRKFPYTKKYLAFLGSSGSINKGNEELLTQNYYWERPLPPIRLVTTSTLSGRWPFSFLPEPIHIDDWIRPKKELV